MERNVRGTIIVAGIGPGDEADVTPAVREAAGNADAILLKEETFQRGRFHRLHPQHDFARTVVRHCQEHCKPLLPAGELTILLIDNNGNIYST